MTLQMRKLKTLLLYTVWSFNTQDSAALTQNFYEKLTSSVRLIFDSKLKANSGFHDWTPNANLREAKWIQNFEIYHNAWGLSCAHSLA